MSKNSSKGNFFTDIVNVSKHDNKLLIIPTEMDNNGNEVVVFDDELIELGSVKLRKTVCGYFVGCKVSLNEARYHLRRMWNKFGLGDVIVNDK